MSPQVVQRVSGTYACWRCGAQYLLRNEPSLLCRSRQCADAGGRLIPFTDQESHHRKMREFVAETRREPIAVKPESEDMANRRNPEIEFLDRDGDVVGNLAFPKGATCVRLIECDYEVGDRCNDVTPEDDEDDEDEDGDDEGED